MANSRQGRGGAPQAPPVDPKYNWSTTPATSSARASSASTAPTRSAAAPSTPSTSRVRACSTGASSARRIRMPRVVSIDLSAAAARPGFQDRARSSATRRPEDQRRHVPGGRSRGRRRGHRRTRDRRGARREGGVRGAARGDQRGFRAGRQGARGVHARATSARAGRRRPATSRRDSRRRHSRLEQTYATPVITHVCMESHGTVCEWDGDKLTAWVSTQGVNSARDNFAAGPRDSADQRPRHLPVHGRRLRQQAAARRRRADLRATGEAGRRAGEADARSQGRASRHRQPSVGGGAHQGRRLGRRHHHRVRRRVVGHGRRRRRRPASRCPTSTRSPTGAARTRTSSSTPASSARCARPGIRRDRSSPKS